MICVYITNEKMKEVIEMKKIIFIGILMALILTACQSNNDLAVPEEPEAETLLVAPFWKPCVGVAPMLCMQVQEAGSEEWTYFYDRIEGFTFEPGNAYELLVKKESVENPPADASSLRWVLVEVVSKSPVEMPVMPLDGSSWKMTSFQGWPLIDGSEITLEFAEGKVGGSASCNRYFADYAHQGVSFALSGPIGSTMMACEENIMQQEMDYLAKLPEMQYIQLDEGKLILTNDTGLFMEFEALED